MNPKRNFNEIPIDGLINLCGIFEQMGPGGKPTGNIGIRNAQGFTPDQFRGRKQEIMDYFAAQHRAHEEREAKIAAIPGLAELDAAHEDLSRWHDEFSRSFEGDCGGLGVRPRPQYDFAAMAERAAQGKRTCSEVLGYDLSGSDSLTINPEEAARVRYIYAAYEEMQSLTAVAAACKARGYRGKRAECLSRGTLR